MLPLDKEAMQEFANFVIKNPLTKTEVRNIVKISKAKKNEFDDQISTERTIFHEKDLIDKALRKSIVLMKSTLVNFDDIVNSVNDDWILKELLMQYRMIIHGDIDTFLKLRKRLRMKMPRGYMNLEREKSDVASISSDEPAIYQWATRGVWQ
jgi:hypothetical protein